MYLRCPSCDTQFQIADGAVGAEGRNVKCGRCQHRWQAYPEPRTPEEVFDAPEADPDEAETAEAVQEQQDVDPPPSLDWAAEVLSDEAAPTTRDVKEARSNRRGWLGWVILLLVLAAIGLALAYARPQIVAFWPPATKLYGLADRLLKPGGDVPENPFVGLEIRLDPTETKFEAGRRVWRLSGQVHNTSKQERPLHFIVVGIKDEKGALLSKVKIVPPQDRIAAGATVKFSTTIPSPPENAAQLEVSMTKE